MDEGPIFVDTWGWLALGHRRDQHHERVRRVYSQALARAMRIHTSDYVLDELITLLFRRETYGEAVRFVEGVFAASASGRLQVERATPERFSAAWGLRKRFQDKPLISFTDLLSMAIMQERGISHILTQDEHFNQVGLGFIRLPRPDR